MDPLPPSPVPTKRILFFVAIALLVVGSLFLTYRSIVASGITKGPDNMFGDQNLKTAVALIELHKVRYGKYPDSLADLKFTGLWDQGALARVRYIPNSDRSAYFVEVEIGWMGKPKLVMPDEFWKGTGYSAALNPNPL
jgi:hypothetical protein